MSEQLYAVGSVVVMTIDTTILDENDETIYRVPYGDTVEIAAYSGRNHQGQHSYEVWHNGWLVSDVCQENLATMEAI